MEKICEHCNETFDAKRKDVVYCSASCRQMAYMNRKLNISSDSVFSDKSNLTGLSINTENTFIESDYTEPKKNEIETINENSNQDFIEQKEIIKKEIIHSESSEPIIYESRFNNTMVDLFNDRENDVALNSCFYSQNNAPSYWVSIRLKCLIECLLMFSEMKYCDVDDLKEVCNAFILMTRSSCFIELPVNYPYTRYIQQLRDKLKQICIDNNHVDRIKFKISKENKMELMVTRFELSHFIPKKKFNDLNFGEFIN